MNRRKIFGWIAGLLGAVVAKAQTNLLVNRYGKCFINGEPADCYPIGWQNGIAKNNQCPVCGTMEPPYNSTDEFFDGGILGKVPYRTSDTNAVRCKKCNVQFWRDADNKILSPKQSSDFR